jgi:hypothetical protein
MLNVTMKPIMADVITASVVLPSVVSSYFMSMLFYLLGVTI